MDSHNDYGHEKRWEYGNIADCGYDYGMDSCIDVVDEKCGDGLKGY